MKNSEVLALGFFDDQGIEESSLEAAHLARDYADDLGVRVRGLVISSDPARAGEFSAASGLPVLSLENPALAAYNCEAYLAVLEEAAAGARALFVAHTATGWDFAPRLAVRLGYSFISGASRVSHGAFVRRTASGKLEMEVAPADDGPVVVTVMPGSVTVERVGAKPEVERIEVTVPGDLGVERLGMVMSAPGGLDLSRAEIVVSAGRGAGEEGVVMLGELASLFDRGALAASRPVVDAGLLSLDHQVGQTGRTIRPRAYLAFGISGAIQHTAGMKDADLIVAVNTDRGAPIFEIAHVGVVEDLRRLVPVLIDKIRGTRN